MCSQPAIGLDNRLVVYVNQVNFPFDTYGAATTGFARTEMVPEAENTGGVGAFMMAYVQS